MIANVAFRLQVIITKVDFKQKKQAAPVTCHGYEVGAMCDNRWDPLVISPILWATPKEAAAQGDRALKAASKALARYKQRRALADKAFLAAREMGGEDHAS